MKTSNASKITAKNFEAAVYLLQNNHEGDFFDETGNTCTCDVCQTIVPLLQYAANMLKTQKSLGGILVTRSTWELADLFVNVEYDGVITVFGQDWQKVAAYEGSSELHWAMQAYRRHYETASIREIFEVSVYMAQIRDKFAAEGMISVYQLTEESPVVAEYDDGLLVYAIMDINNRLRNNLPVDIETVQMFFGRNCLCATPLNPPTKHKRWCPAVYKGPVKPTS